MPEHPYLQWPVFRRSVVAAFQRSLTHGVGVSLATLLLDAGARTDIRDEFLKSTPLGWACRWGREALVELLLARAADPIEAGAEPWATPLAWAERRHHAGIASILRQRGAGR